MSEAETPVAAPVAAPAVAAPAATGFDALKGLGAAAADQIVYEQARRPGPRLCDRQAQERHRQGVDQAGKGTITINGRDQEIYFARPVLRMMIAQPLEIADRLGQFDVVVSVQGSGLSGQAGAVRHGLSKALTYYEPGLRAVLKPHGFLTRDSRVVERKKYGKAKARRSFQFSKR